MQSDDADAYYRDRDPQERETDAIYEPEEQPYEPQAPVADVRELLV